jgi:hypothetical protein
MSSFWPDGFEISDTESPRDILNTAKEDWQKNSNGLMDLVLQDAESESGNPIIIVHAKHVVKNRTSMLFSIVHQPEQPYPVTIEPKGEKIPDFLQKSYYEPIPQGSPLLADSILGTRILGTARDLIPKQVVNKWVSDTPSEFREKLSEVLNLGFIKREMLNLASSAKDNLNNTDLDSEM